MSKKIILKKIKPNIYFFVVKRKHKIIDILAYSLNKHLYNFDRKKFDFYLKQGFIVSKTISSKIKQVFLEELHI